MFAKADQIGSNNATRNDVLSNQIEERPTVNTVKYDDFIAY